MTTKKHPSTQERPTKKLKKAGRYRNRQERELAERRDYLLKESIVMLAADLYQDIYDSDGCDGFTEACETIIQLAEKFERKLNWIERGDDLDYLEELEKFETNVRKRLHIGKP